MDKIELLIDIIRARPMMYIGLPSVTRLSMFLAGYHFAVAKCCDNEFFALAQSEFRDWLASQYSEKSMVGWEEILLTQTNNDEELAFDLFWKKWDEFCKEK